MTAPAPAGPQAGLEPENQPVPYTLTPAAEDLLDAEAEAEIEAADEWDCVESTAYQLRVEAGLEPEAEP